MPENSPLPEPYEVHDPAILAHARAVLDACRTPREMGEAVLAAVARNETLRGRQCLNLLAPEAPTSPTVRALLSSEVGTRPPKVISARSIAGLPGRATLTRLKPSVSNS